MPCKQLTPSLYMLFFCDLAVDMKDQIWLGNNHLSLINFNRLPFSWTKNRMRFLAYQCSCCIQKSLAITSDRIQFFKFL